MPFLRIPPRRGPRLPKGNEAPANSLKPRQRKASSLDQDSCLVPYPTADAKGTQAGGHGMESQGSPQTRIESVEYWWLEEHASHNVHQSAQSQ
jgi:hypothetical protein